MTLLGKISIFGTKTCGESGYLLDRLRTMILRFTFECYSYETSWLSTQASRPSNSITRFQVGTEDSGKSWTDDCCNCLVLGYLGSMDYFRNRAIRVVSRVVYVVQISNQEKIEFFFQDKTAKYWQQCCQCWQQRIFLAAKNSPTVRFDFIVNGSWVQYSARSAILTW